MYLKLCLKNSIRDQKMSFRVNFRFISGEISNEKILGDFIPPKDSSLNFRGRLFSYFCAIALISAVMSIFEDFGSLLPTRPVAVKFDNLNL